MTTLTNAKALRAKQSARKGHPRYGDPLTLIERDIMRIIAQHDGHYFDPSWGNELEVAAGVHEGDATGAIVRALVARGYVQVGDYQARLAVSSTLTGRVQASLHLLSENGGTLHVGSFKPDVSDFITRNGLVTVEGEQAEIFRLSAKGETCIKGSASTKEETAPMSKPKAPKTAKQTSMPGTERKRSTKITTCAERYREARDKAIKAGNVAAEAKSALLLMLTDPANAKYLAEVEGERVYIDEEAKLKLTYSNKENVKLRTLTDDDEDDQE